MSPTLILSCIAGYFSILLLIAWVTSRNADDDAYFLGGKKSPWFAVAFGLIADSLSGVTFISVPGAVGTGGFSYMQVVFGYFFGYIIIAYVLMPVYYKMNLTSIYGYLGQRLGTIPEKTGSFFFLLSRTIGAAGRLFIAATVLQIFVFDHICIATDAQGQCIPFPFWLSVSIIIALILVYTFKGGIKTLVWTDVFQSSFLLIGVILSIVAILSQLDFGIGEAATKASESGLTKLFNWDWKSGGFFFKQFIGGMFIAIAMSGLDQNMMQKQLSCKSPRDAQKNLISFSFIVIVVNLFFLSLGALLYLYQSQENIGMPLTALGKPDTDKLFPLLALNHLGTFAGLAFIIGLTAATFSSADSVLTTLTTSVYVDFLKLDQKSKYSDAEKLKIRRAIHIGFAIVMLGVIMLFRAFNDSAIIDKILFLAGFTYGPLLGLFTFGLFTKRGVIQPLVPVVCILSPVLCWFLSQNSVAWFGGYKFGYELLILNGALTFFGLMLISKKGIDGKF